MLYNPHGRVGVCIMYYDDAIPNTVGAILLDASGCNWRGKLCFYCSVKLNLCSSVLVLQVICSNSGHFSIIL